MDDTRYGRELLEVALARVQRNAGEIWWHQAMNCVARYRNTFAQQAKTFTAPGFLSYAQRFFGLPDPPEPRVMGAVMREAVKAGLIEKTDRFEPSPNPRQHLRPVQVWRLKV